MRLFLFITSLVIFAAVLTAPLVTFAQANYGSAVNKARDAVNKSEARTDVLQDSVQSSLCTRIDTLLAQKSDRFTVKERAVNTVQSRRAATWDSRTKTRATQLETHRQTWDENRLQHFAKLQARANTPERQAAVDAFVATVHEAIELRRQAVDTAVQTYRNGFTMLLEERKTILNAAIDEYKSDVAVALDAAKIDCISGVENTTVKSTLQGAFEAAKKNLQQAREDLKGKSGQLEVLQQARRQAIAAAVQKYQETVQKAKTILKQQFGEAL